jgi:hypothetical protein
LCEVRGQTGAGPIHCLLLSISATLLVPFPAEKPEIELQPSMLTGYELVAQLFFNIGTQGHTGIFECSRFFKREKMERQANSISAVEEGE